MLILTVGTLDLSPFLSPHSTWHIIHYAAEAGFFNAVVDAQPALVMLDGDAPNWLRYAHALKSSPATRRIPLLVFSKDAQTREHALAQGADYSETRALLVRDLERIVKATARQSDPARTEALLGECDTPLPERAREGIAKFNAGEYYTQHDLLEAEWVETEQPVRDLYRAILQVGVAYYQIERGNYKGALKMLQRSVQWLLLLPDVCQGVDVRTLREDSFRVRAELLRLGEARFGEFDRTLMKGVRMV